MGLVVLLVLMLGFALVLGAAFIVARALTRRTRVALFAPLLIGSCLGLLALNPYWITRGPDDPQADLDRFVLWVLFGLPGAIGLAVGAGAGWCARRPRGTSWDEVEW
ncbi:hypothetical protein [Aquicoccus sp. SU-CL01552]|uniref:hypothetical protein n=1 Tax=Aquicoccus sp. SU-CL01552 TaxID=3127656 RepID=UPI003109EB41